MMETFHYYLNYYLVPVNSVLNTTYGTYSMLLTYLFNFKHGSNENNALATPICQETHG